MFIDILNLKEFKNYDFSSLNTGTYGVAYYYAW